MHYRTIYCNLNGYIKDRKYCSVTSNGDNTGAFSFATPGLKIWNYC